MRGFDYYELYVKPRHCSVPTGGDLDKQSLRGYVDKDSFFVSYSNKLDAVDGTIESVVARVARHLCQGLTDDMQAKIRGTNKSYHKRFYNGAGNCIGELALIPKTRPKKKWWQIWK